MLKIWLTWLQPSLGVLGTALVLSYPLYSHAAPKPVVTGKFNKVNKVPTQVSLWSVARSSGTTIDNELSSAIAVTPDMAVRQLAMGSMVTSGFQPKIAPKKTVQNSRDPLAKFVPPASAKFQNLSAKPTKPQNVKNSVAEALARASKIQAPVTVPGLYIGTADVRVSAKVLPTPKPLAQAIASSEIGAPTPLSAMMGAKVTAVDPFPVVRPELMQKLDRHNTANRPTIQKTTQSLDPIAAIQTGRPKAVVPKAQAIAPKAPEYHSLDPIAAIPSGLQRLLGNNINSGSTIATAPVVKTTTTPNAMVALKQFISPTSETAPAPVSAASLQLATAQAYASAPPKFSIPGETILAAKSVKPTNNVLIVNRVQKNLTATVPARKSKYVAILSDRQLTPTPKQPWMLFDRPTNLGGLILGSQAPAVMPRMAGLIPLNMLKDPTSVGLPARNILDVN
jgi:hypothetical protein